MHLGDRMKAYEETFRQKLPIRMPAVVRLDGKAFHTLTRGCEKPFDKSIQSAMIAGTSAVLEDMPARMAYAQSDEVSFLLIDYNKFDSMQYFDGTVQKIVSVAASIMGAHFTKAYGKAGYFDARVFVVPERDIINYFIWRQKDCMRNSISACAQAEFSAKQLHGRITTSPTMFIPVMLLAVVFTGNRVGNPSSFTSMTEPFGSLTRST